jgi:cell division protein FtsN
VLEGRHVIGLFLLMLLFSGVFFSLGYVMGRTQYGGAVHAADSPVIPPPVKSSPAKAKDAEPAPAPANTEWDFYAKKDTTRLEPPKDAAPPPASVPAVAKKTSGTPPAASAKPVAAPAKSPASYQPPKLPKGSLLLQVAALKREGDALKMADEIQQKHFPAFVIMQPADGYYHVQVGPYMDQKTAEAAKRALEQTGFKSIIKR